MQIIKPTFIVDKKRALANILRMQEKIDASGKGIRFRPHFKTHQSLEVGNWFRERGIPSIAVSSVDMAVLFAGAGWKDITIAVLVNHLEIHRINLLAASTTLHLLVDSLETTNFLDETLTRPVEIWIKIDTGYHRTGIEWKLRKEILALAKTISQSKMLRFKELLTHAGHAYRTQSILQLTDIYHETITKMQHLREHLLQNGISAVEISYGDTPTCSIMETFYGVNEIRCGNFIYYDVQQFFLHACLGEDIAVAVACPIIAKYPQRNEIVIYGGAVHLSKDSAVDANGQKIFGLVALPHPGTDTWGPLLENTYVLSLSQEHGVIKTTPYILQQLKVGDILMILPVHSCLAANLLIHNTQYI